MYVCVRMLSTQPYHNSHSNHPITPPSVALPSPHPAGHSQGDRAQASLPTSQDAAVEDLRGLREKYKIASDYTMQVGIMACF